MKARPLLARPEFSYYIGCTLLWRYRGANEKGEKWSGGRWQPATTLLSKQKAHHKSNLAAAKEYRPAAFEA